MKLLQINTTVNSGSTGRIAEDIGKILLANGHQSTIAFGRGDGNSQSELIKVGNKVDMYFHGLKTLTFDRHGFSSKKATSQLINKIDEHSPDVIGLHNIHGYYLHIDVLFNYLKRKGTPVIWTLHDCWPFTGHCSYFNFVECYKWKTHCKSCPLTKQYPRSLIIDNSFKNYEDKKRIFTDHPNLKIVTPSKWLGDLIPDSFLSDYPVEVIYNGIDLDVFRIKPVIKEKKVILGVAAQWSRRKGLPDFISLRKELPDDYEMVLIGLSQKQIGALPPGIKGISRTENMEELVDWYNKASVFINPTYVDNFPTTNIEALACGTPVITYNTGGSPEAIDEHTGKVVEKGDIQGLVNAIHFFADNAVEQLSISCRRRAEDNFDKNDRFQDYLHLYERFTAQVSA